MGARRLVVVLLGGAALVGSLLAGSSASAQPDCGPHGRLLPAVGDYPPACEYINPDPPPGHDRSRPDLTELAARGGGTVPPGAGVTAATPASVPCDNAGDGAYRVQAVYAYDPARPGGDRYATVKPLIQRWAVGIDATFQRSAAKTGGTRSVRWVTEPDGQGGCVVSVAKVPVRAPSLASSSLDDLRTDLITAGFQRADRRYLTWADTNVLCGLGSTYNFDPSPGQSNLNNGSGGPAYSRVDAICWGFYESAEAHELMHNLGAVQASSPNRSSFAHCTDESDLMCYDDDGAGPAAVRQVCPRSEESLFDCNNDDYFSTNPAPGSWLADNWNTADSRFLIGGGDGTSGGTRGTTRVTLTADPKPAGSPTPLRVDVITPDAYTTDWSTLTGGCVVTGAGDTATLQCPVDVRSAQVTAHVHRPGGVDSTVSQLVTLPAPTPVLAVGGPTSATTLACLPGTGTARVTVTQGAGGPGLRGVGVVVTRRGTPVARGVTGPDGVALVDVPAGARSIFEVRLDGARKHQGYVRLDSACRATLGGTQLSTSQVPQGAGVSVSGTATRDGRPVENLPVTVTYPGGTLTTRSDDRGAYQATWPMAGSGPVSVTGGGSTASAGSVTLADWRTSIVADQQGSPTGPVLAGLAYRSRPDGRGPEPRVGARVSGRVGTWTGTTTTDQFGRFWIPVPAQTATPGTAWSAGIAAGDGHQGASAAGTFGRTVDVRVYADPPAQVSPQATWATVSGYVLGPGPGQTMLTGGQVQVDAIVADGTRVSGRTTVGEGGAWRVDLPAFPMSAVTVRVTGADGSVVSSDAQLTASLPLSAAIQLDRVPPAAPGPGPIVRGRLVLNGQADALNVDLAGRVVSVRYQAGGGVTGTVSTVSAADGTFAATLPPMAAEYSVTVSAPWQFPLWVSDADGASARL